MEPNFPLFHVALARPYCAKGMYREGTAEWQKYQDLTPGAYGLANLIYCYGRAGDRNRALHALDMLQENSRKGFVPAYSFALAYTGLDEKDQAFARLEEALKNRESFLAFLKADPIWGPLNADPRFADLLRRIGLPQ